MSNSANGAVSISLRNDGIDLEEESDKGDGKGPAVKEILNARNKAMHRWNTFFIMVSAFAVFIDPLFCYIFVIERYKVCINYDKKLAATYIVLRMAIDVFYFIDILIFLCGICKKRKDRKFGACCWKPGTDQMSTVIPSKQVIKRRCFRLLPILPRILVALPIPEGLLYYAVFAIFVDPIYAILIMTPQYTLRIFLIYGSKRWRPIKETTTGRWLKPLLDFLPFILASHLFGALWYSLAIQRQVDCWKPHCRRHHEAEVMNICKYFADFRCYRDGELNTKPTLNFTLPTLNLTSPKLNYTLPSVNITLADLFCPINSEDKTVFDFGIYLYALQSTSTSSFNLPQRISQSFWWALRNLSSFGSNLLTSMHTLEIFFSIAISISGMVLFLVYLNVRIKESQERSAQLILKEKKHLMRPDLDLWLCKNVSKKKALKTVIIENMHKLEETQAIDLQSIIFILPIGYKKSIKRLLCLASLRKVPMLAKLDKKLLKVICDHLKPIIYIEDNYIVQEGKPLGMMLLITQGIAYTIGNNDGVGTSYGSSSNKWLKRGDYYGEELLDWAFKCPIYSDLPISSRTILSQQKVEAFALRASDLRSIVSIYWWHFTKDQPEIQHEQWTNLAASSTQAAWRRARAKPSGWGKFTVE